MGNEFAYIFIIDEVITKIGTSE